MLQGSLIIIAVFLGIMTSVTFDLPKLLNLCALLHINIIQPCKYEEISLLVVEGSE